MDSGDVIQSIYYRFQDKRAIILAFYDIRDAERVKRLIEANSLRPHYGPDVGDEQKTTYESTVGSPWVEGLTCLFVAPDHFLQVGSPLISCRSALNFRSSLTGQHQLP